jgi:hypothetical protein
VSEVHITTAKFNQCPLRNDAATAAVAAAISIDGNRGGASGLGLGFVERADGEERGEEIHCVFSLCVVDWAVL